MALSVLILSCFLFYLSSKYFPLGEEYVKVLRSKRVTINIGATILLAVSLWMFRFDFDAVTAFVIWLTALMTILSAIILTVKLSVKWLYAWGVLCVFLLLLDVF